MNYKNPCINSGGGLTVVSVSEVCAETTEDAEPAMSVKPARRRVFSRGGPPCDKDSQIHHFRDRIAMIQHSRPMHARLEIIIMIS